MWPFKNDVSEDICQEYAHNIMLSVRENSNCINDKKWYDPDLV